MLRQRLQTRGNPSALVGQLLVLLLGAALVWYGLMLALLALKVSPPTINGLGGYRSAYDFFAGLTPGDLTGTRRAIIAGAGIAAFLVLGVLGVRALPRPYLARHELDLAAGGRGDTLVAPRAIERLGESAALGHPRITDAAGRYSVDELTITVSTDRARDLAGTLTEVHARVLAALDQHELPRMPARVTLTGFDRKHRRELN